MFYFFCNIYIIIEKAQFIIKTHKINGYTKHYHSKAINIKLKCLKNDFIKFWQSKRNCLKEAWRNKSHQKSDWPNNTWFWDIKWCIVPKSGYDGKRGHPHIHYWVRDQTTKDFSKVHVLEPRSKIPIELMDKFIRSSSLLCFSLLEILLTLYPLPHIVRCDISSQEHLNLNCKLIFCLGVLVLDIFQCFGITTIGWKWCMDQLNYMV